MKNENGFSTTTSYMFDAAAFLQEKAKRQTHSTVPQITISDFEGGCFGLGFPLWKR